MKTIRIMLAKLRRDERGATAIEYGLIAALISVAIIGGATALGTGISDTFGTIKDELGGAAGGEGDEG